MKIRIPAILTSSLLALGLISCGHKEPPEVVNPGAEANDKSIVIVFENDVHCNVDGYLRFAGYRDAVADTAYVATVSSGDFIQGGAVGAFSRGEYIIDIMNAVGYDAVTIGNHEFDYKVPRLLELMDRLDAPVTCVNLEDCSTGRQVFAPYVIKQMGKKKVAFVGVTTPSSLNKESYAFYDDDHNLLYDLKDSGLNSLVQAAVDAARADGADYVILLSHLGELEDSCDSNALTVIAGTSGIDAVLDGHTHSTIYERTVRNAAGKPVILAQTGSKFSHVGCLTISRSGSIHADLVSVSKISRTSAKVQAVLDKVNDICGELMSTVLTSSDFPLTITDENGRRAVRSMETNLGDIITDGMRHVTGAQVAFMNGGGISTTIPAGDVTWRNVYDSQPFGNSITLLKVLGQRIIDHLEVCSVSCPYESGSFMQVSGLSYKINTSYTNKLYLYRTDYELHVEGDRRVSNVRVLGEDGRYRPIDPMKFYTVATINFIADTFDSFPVLYPCEHLADEIMSDVECFGQYLQSLGGKIPEEYRTPQGRISITN